MKMTLYIAKENINYNIRKILEELRKRIMDIQEVNETIDDGQIIYQHFGEDFCVIKIKKNSLEIDFKANKILEDPMEFSWKIKPTIEQKFNRRMQLKNIAQIDTVFGLIFQACNITGTK